MKAEESIKNRINELEVYQSQTKNYGVKESIKQEIIILSWVLNNDNSNCTDEF